jgi:hypothetical protein
MIGGTVRKIGPLNPADIQAYYLRNEFNLGDGAGGDLMATATAVEFI